jgi:hypothetical protein
MAITVPASKTDPFRKGVTIYIAAVPGSSTCAVAAMKNLFIVDPRPPNSPLFVDSMGAPLTRAQFISELQLHLVAAAITDDGYSGHSFRRGAASAAAAAGFSDYKIQLLGRWRSDAYRLYIDIQLDRLLLSSRLHRNRLAGASAQPFEPLSLPFAPGLAQAPSS